MGRMQRNAPRSLMQLPTAIVQVDVTGEGAQAGSTKFLDALLPLGALLSTGGHELRSNVRYTINMPQNIGAGEAAAFALKESLIASAHA
jgi:hypothetical protein